MKHLVYKERLSLRVYSGNTHLIESVEIKGGLYVISEALYLENKELIDGVLPNPEIRVIGDDEWIKDEE